MAYYYKNNTTLAAAITALKVDIAAIETSIVNSGSNDIKGYTINGRSLERIPLDEKQKLLNSLYAKLKSHENQESIAAGNGNRRTIKVQF